jgi:hypothetical protein
MRNAIAFCFVLFLAPGLEAQRGAQPVFRGAAPTVVRPAGTPTVTGAARIFGNGVAPGIPVTHLVAPGAAMPTGQNVPRFIDRSRRATGYIMTYPLYVGGYYDASYGGQPYPDSQAPPAQQNVTVVYPPQGPAATMMNPYVPGATTDNFGQGTMAELAPPDEAAPEPAYYLIALKDHHIYAAVAYWADGETLHYFTSGNTHNQVSLALVDRDLTTRLNKDSGVEVKLPDAKQ